MLNSEDVLASNDDKAKYIRHIPKTTGFAYSMGVQIDFNNPYFIQNI